MLPYQMIAGGTFTISETGGVASGVTVNCQSQDPPDFIIARAITGWGEANDAQSIEWWWQKSMAQGSAKGMLQSSAALNSPALTSTFLDSDGISTYDTFDPPTFSALAVTNISSANPAVVTVASTATLATGDIVRMYSGTKTVGPTYYDQIGGWDFRINVINTTTFGLTYLNSTGFTNSGGVAAAATGGVAQKIIQNGMYPRWRFITNITAAAQAVVTFSVDHDFTAGEIITLYVPTEFGMDEANGQQARVLSTTASTVTLDLNTVGFTTFAFPTSATALAGVSFPRAVPSSSGVVPLAGSATVPQQPPGTNLQDAFDNRGNRVIKFGAGLFNIASFVSDNNDVWEWRAYKYDQYNGN